MTGVPTDNKLNPGMRMACQKILKIDFQRPNSPFRIKYCIFMHCLHVLTIVLEAKNSGNPLNSIKFSSL